MASLEDPRDTEGRLISAGSVSGSDVYDHAGNRLGSVRDVMIDKESGRIAYAILSFGGLLGFGDRRHPLPWSSLRYDRTLAGYVVDLDRDRLQGAPSYAEDEPIAWNDARWGERLHEYYKAEPYWQAAI